MNFNDYNTRWDFEREMERKDAADIFEDILRDDLTTEQLNILVNYLFGVNRDFAAAGHFLMEIATPAAEFVVRKRRERLAPFDGEDVNAEDRAYELRRQDDLDRGAA